MPNPNDSPPAFPERIGAYRIERRLGRGGMGDVFLAWDDRLERWVAIKRIRHDGARPPAQRERFRREARAAARLSHPALVQVHDLVEDSAGDAIVMEYVEGATLAERLARGPLPAAEAVRLARQIAEGLAAAHAAGLIHRDLKAENVLVTPAGQAKILDFGLARTVLPDDGEEALTQRGVLVGTYHAMSPEQAGGGEVDPRSDLFSLGALLSEMLTGRSPFRGANPLDTLKRVLTETPPPLAQVRPDLPSGLAELVDRLLAKERGERPRRALDVVRSLSEIESRTGPAEPPESSESVSDLPTHPVPITPITPIIRRTPSSSSFAGLPLRRRPGLAALAALVLAALAGGGLYLAERGPAKMIRIAIAKPEVRPAGSDRSDPRLLLAASSVVSSALSSLASLEGLAPIDPGETSRSDRPPSETARIVAADEVVAAEVEAQEGGIGGGMGRVSLRRIQGSDGRVLWSETFAVPTDPESLRLLADAVAVHLRRGYPGHRLRPGTPELDARDEDYTAFLEVKQRIDGGEAVLDPELQRLEEIVRRSPRFLEAQIQAAQVALSLFRSKREPSYLDRAAVPVRLAKELAPNDPRPLLPEFQIALLSGREKDAEEILAQMERLLPGDPEVLLQRSRLAERQGHLDAALRDLRTATARSPSWKNLFWLASLEGRLGRLAEAREHCGAVLRQAPGNQWAREQLALLEMQYGDLGRAEELYTDLTRDARRSSRFINLGTVRFLRGRYAEAAAAFRQALEIDPGQYTALINLADAETELGHTAQAAGLYRQTLARIEENERTVGLPPDDGMIKAECLARLGRHREAAALAQEILRRSPDERDLLYEASLVYSLVGDRNSALGNAQAALEKGESPRLFTGSAFRPLLDGPELRTLLAGASTSGSPEARPGASSGSAPRRSSAPLH